jgi:murein DD-endopeptidase MepM/ murein hydrolase activator NlpD
LAFSKLDNSGSMPKCIFVNEPFDWHDDQPPRHPWSKTVDRGEYCYYYAHLERYTEGLLEGMRVARGDILGFVGSTGNADSRTPHLHFAIFEFGGGRPLTPILAW